MKVKYFQVLVSAMSASAIFTNKGVAKIIN